MSFALPQVIILLPSSSEASLVESSNALVRELARLSIPATLRLQLPAQLPPQTVVLCHSEAELLPGSACAQISAPALLIRPGVALQVAKIFALYDFAVQAKLQVRLEEDRVARKVADCELKSHAFVPRILPKLEATFAQTDLKYANKYIGKVRDRYQSGDKMILITTDRLTGFDRPLCKIPYKGQVLNLISQYWFAETRHIIKNHLLSVPHPNVSIGMECTVFPIEFVVRAYLTGSSGTSIWTHYKKGIREYCGIKLPDGMRQNERFPEILLTPTTKSDEHDELISAKEIVEQKWMTQEDWDFCSEKCLQIFEHAAKIARSRGLVLVDTKMEFGRNVATGEIVLIDELLTPDSSRYWLAEGLDEAIERGTPPANIDKEFVRLWFRDHCDPYKDEVLPEAPAEIRVELARRYIMLYELITGKDFEFLDDAGLETSVANALEAGKSALLLVDPQVDFVTGSLAVPGAAEDCARVCAQLAKDKVMHNIAQVFVTLDSHGREHIAHASFWEPKPEPFTQISLAQVKRGEYAPANAADLRWALHYLEQLEREGKFKLTIWPEHCIEGTPGHEVYAPYKDWIAQWEQATNRRCIYLRKGQNRLTEHFSAIRPEVLVPGVDCTSEGDAFVQKVLGFDSLIVCGEAKSHCVNFTVRDIQARNAERKTSMFVIADGCSNVRGYEAEGAKFEKDMTAQGVQFLDAKAVFDLASV